MYIGMDWSSKNLIILRKEKRQKDVIVGEKNKK